MAKAAAARKDDDQKSHWLPLTAMLLGGIGAARHIEGPSSRADGKPVTFEQVDPRTIKADPATFQFKSGGDASGVTDRMAGVNKWDQIAAGKAIVWERGDGERFVADGHQRRGLALRAIEAGQKNVALDAYVMKERDGWTSKDVRAYAALKNMKELSGSAVDFAKVVRERPDLIDGSLPMSDGKIKQAMSLSKLSEPAFNMVVSGGVKPEHAAAVGDAVRDPSRHVGMLAEMAKAGMGSEQHARLYVAQALAAPELHETTGSLFGEETNVRSLLAERAKVLDKAMTALKSDKRIFGLLEREAAHIEAAGNKLSHEINAAKADIAGQTAQLIEKLATTRGPVSSMLDAAAKAIAEGQTPSQAARSFVRQVGDTMQTGGIHALMGTEAPKAAEPVDPNQGHMFGAESAMAKKSKMLHVVYSGGDRGRNHEVHETFDDVKSAQQFAAAHNRELGKSANSMTRAFVHSGTKEDLAASEGFGQAFRDATGQSSMFGEPTTKDKIAAEVRAKEAKGRVGDPANEGLFGSSSKQTDLVEAVKAAASPAKGYGIHFDPATNMVVSEGPTFRRTYNAGTHGYESAYWRATNDTQRLALKDGNAPIKVTAPNPSEHAKSNIVDAVASVTRSAKAAGASPFDAEREWTQKGIKDSAGNVWKKEPGGSAWSIDRSSLTNPPGWSDSARSRSAEVRKEKAGSNAPSAGGAVEKVTQARKGADTFSAELRSRLEKLPKSELRHLADPTLPHRTSRAQLIDLAHAKTLSDAAYNNKNQTHFGASRGISYESVVIERLDNMIGKAPSKPPRSRSGDRTSASPANAGSVNQNHLKGTQNEANLSAIVEGRKAKAKGGAAAQRSKAPAAPEGLNPKGRYQFVGESRTLERGPVNVYMNKETGVHVVADKGGAFDIEGHPLGARQAPSGIEMAAAAKNPKARFHDSAAKQTDHVEFKPAKGLGRGAKKALGLLAPVAIGAAMLSAANEAKAEGTSQTKAAVKEGAKGAGTMALFVGGTAAATASLMKAGMTAAKAVPAVNVGMMAGNALLEAYAHRKDGGAGMAKAAAKGAWDMSLPGMAVNAGMAAKDAVQGRMAVTAPSTSAPASFQAASDRFQAMRAAAATSDPGEKKKGWSNAARIGAYKARMAKSGGSPTNLPYGGALTPPAPLKG